mgnify:CR=1 FL=1
MSDLTLEHQQERKKLLHERDTYQAENTQLQRQVDELSKKFNLSQTKLATINKQMTSVLSSHGALNAGGQPHALGGVYPAFAIDVGTGGATWQIAVDDRRGLCANYSAN